MLELQVLLVCSLLSVKVEKEFVVTVSSSVFVCVML